MGGCCVVGEALVFGDKGAYRGVHVWHAAVVLRHVFMQIHEHSINTPCPICPIRVQCLCGNMWWYPNPPETVAWWKNKKGYCSPCMLI